MYFAQIDDLRFIIDSHIKIGQDYHKVKFVFDPGAKRTCLETLLARTIQNYTVTGYTNNMSGAVEGSTIPVRVIIVDSLEFGDIVLFNQRILLPDGDGVPKSMLGMDILETLDFHYRSSLKSLIIGYPKFESVPTNSQQIAVNKILHDMGVLSKENHDAVMNALPKVDMLYTDLVHCVEKALEFK